MAGVAKAYNLSFEYVLYELSYKNLIMFSAVLPSYDFDSKDDKKAKEVETFDAGDPANIELIKAFSETYG